MSFLSPAVTLGDIVDSDGEVEEGEVEIRIDDGSDEVCVDIRAGNTNVVLPLKQFQRALAFLQQEYEEDS